MMPCSNAYGGPALPSCKRKACVEQLRVTACTVHSTSSTCAIWRRDLARRRSLRACTAPAYHSNLNSMNDMEATHRRNRLIAIESAAFEFIGAGQLRYECASLWRLVPE